MRGQQQPRVSWVPDSAGSAGDEAVDLVEMAGLTLDPWEELVLRESLGEKPDGRWAAFEVGLVVPRQNGKNEIAIARELAGLFLLGERLMLHSAHQIDTSLEAFRRLLDYIESVPDFDRRVQRVSRTNGQEGIELKGGQRIRFRTRTKSGGRGFSADWLLLDEAMELAEAFHGALLPTVSARPNPQVWYMGSAVDQWVHDHGVVFSRIRARGHKGNDPSLAFFEWSADPGHDEDGEELGPEDAAHLSDDQEAWAQANPGFGIRISSEHIAGEQRSMDPRTFAVERLGIGDWPQTDGLANQVIADETWKECSDPESEVEDPVCFCFDVSPDRSRAAIAVAGPADGYWHGEVVEHRAGTGWVAERLEELEDRWRPVATLYDERGPAASLVRDIEGRGVGLTTVDSKEYAQACGEFFDLCDQALFRHLNTPELNAAVKGAVTRPLGDAWAWSRKSSTTDITPLVAVTLAVWGASKNDPRSGYQDRDLLILS